MFGNNLLRLYFLARLLFQFNALLSHVRTGLHDILLKITTIEGIRKVTNIYIIQI